MNTDISPIVDDIDKLYESDLKILVVLYHNGGRMEPEELEIYTGLHLRTVKKSLKKPRVRQLINKMGKKSALDQMLFKQRKDIERLLKEGNLEAEIPNT
jgi:hypothetical protein